MEQHESLLAVAVVYVGSSLGVVVVVVVVVAGIEAVVDGGPTAEKPLQRRRRRQQRQVLRGYSWMRPLTFVYYSAILVSATLAVCWDCWLPPADDDCPSHDERRSRPESFVYGITKIYQTILLGDAEIYLGEYF